MTGQDTLTILSAKNRAEMAALINTYGGIVVYEAVRDAAAKVTAALRDGVPVPTWRTLPGPGTLVLYQVDPTIPEGEQQPALPGTTILCVNAPESDRARWEQLARAEAPDDPALVIMDAFRPFIAPEADDEDESEIPF